MDERRTELRRKWEEIQDSLKRKLIIQDDLRDEVLKYVGGVDLSFSKEDPSIACAALVVLNLGNLDVVYEDSSIFNLQVPYVPGFLAFREAPVLLQLLEKMKQGAHPFYPQLLMVDGNGILHPRGFGSACHIGVLADLPTIGIGKNLHHVDGITMDGVKKLLEVEGPLSKDVFPLIGDSGSTLGAAVKSSNGSSKPIFISVGHRISLATAINIVKMTCRFRIPEPIRQADVRSKLKLNAACTPKCAVEIYS